MNKSGLPYHLVNNQANLTSLVGEIQKESFIGVDLEADSLFNYPEKVCLLQISTPHQYFLIDVLCVQNLSALSPIFSDPHIIKVFHGADYDVRSLYRDFSIEIHALFDTQIAARFLGIKETGLAHLLKTQFGVDIEKKFQKRDWSQRPLPDSMLMYAVQDIYHLLPLYTVLRKNLQAIHRLPWVEEECEILSRVRPTLDADDPLFLRFKGARTLDSRTLTVLEALLQLRKETAIRRNLPPFKILNNSTIHDLATKRPQDAGDLERIDGLSEKQKTRLGSTILRTIANAIKVPEEKMPHYPLRSGIPTTHSKRKKLKLLKEWREQRALELGIDTSLVFTNSQIQAIAHACPQQPRHLERIDGIRHWQRELFATNICSFFKPLQPHSR